MTEFKQIVYQTLQISYVPRTLSLNIVIYYLEIFILKCIGYQQAVVVELCLEGHNNILRYYGFVSKRFSINIDEFAIAYRWDNLYSDIIIAGANVKEYLNRVI